MRQANEPSVEEILDSIKKVIARDNRVATESPARRATSAPVIQDEEEDVLDLETAGEVVEEVAAEGPLLPRETVSSISESLAALAVMAEPRAAPQIVRSGETSLEGLTRELLRPASPNGSTRTCRRWSKRWSRPKLPGSSASAFKNCRPNQIGIARNAVTKQSGLDTAATAANPARMKKSATALCALAFALSAAPALAQTAPRAMTAEDLITLKRVGAPAASPDGQWVVFQQTDTDPQSYSRNTGLWRVAAKGGTAQRIADIPDAGENSPAFSPDGKRLYFISDKSGKDQVWFLDLTVPGAAPVRASDFKADVAGFQLSPDGKRLLVWGDVARDCPTLGCDNSGDTSQPGARHRPPLQERHRLRPPLGQLGNAGQLQPRLCREPGGRWHGNRRCSCTGWPGWHADRRYAVETDGRRGGTGLGRRFEERVLHRAPV